MDSRRSARTASQLLMLLATGLVLLALRPFGEPLFMASVLSGALYPVQRWLTGKLWQRPGLAAALVCFAVVSALLAPAVGFTAAALRDVTAFARSMTDILQAHGLTGLIDRLPPAAADVVHRLMEQFSVEEEDALQQLQGTLMQRGSQLASIATTTLARAGGMRSMRR